MSIRSCSLANVPGYSCCPIFRVLLVQSLYPKVLMSDMHRMQLCMCLHISWARSKLSVDPKHLTIWCSKCICCAAIQRYSKNLQLSCLETKCQGIIITCTAKAKYTHTQLDADPDSSECSAGITANLSHSKAKAAPLLP